MTEEINEIYGRVSDMLFEDICEYYLLAVEEFVPTDDEGYYVYSTGESVLRGIFEGRIRFPFNKEDYDRNTDIQDSLTALGIDSEKFWYAVLFIHHFAEDKCMNSFVLPESTTREDIVSLIKCLGEKDVKVTFESKDRQPYTINRKLVLNILSEMLSIGYESIKDREYLDYAPVDLKVLEKEKEYSVSYQIVYEAKAYKSLLEKISRPKSEVKDFRKGSRDKLLLISRLMYFTRLTRNESYLSGTDSIKGLLKSYKNKKITGISSDYLF